METTAPKKHAVRTTFQRMLVLLLAVLVGQMAIYLLTFVFSGVLDQTDRNSFDILTERTANRKLDLSNDMVGRWSNLDEGESEVLAVMGQVLNAADASAADLRTDSALRQTVLEACAPEIVSILRHRGVTDTFLVLDCDEEETEHPGIYVRDYDPSSYSADNTDLLMERGGPGIARSLGIPMDSFWTARFSLDRHSPSSDFFFKPMEAALGAEAEDRGGDYFHYWSGHLALSDSDRTVMSYSIPLVWEDGTVIGVLGVGVTKDYLAEQLMYDELGEERTGAYFLGVSRDGGSTYETVCSSGPSFRAYFGSADSLSVTESQHSGIVTIDGTGTYGEQTIYGAVQKLRLYDNNTPFEGEEWALIGIMSGEHLLGFSAQLKGLLLLSAAISLALGLVLVILAARSYTHPIGRLMEELEGSDPDKPIQLIRTSISELDALSEAIENLSNAAAESAARISKIVSMSHIPIGVFEYRADTTRVFCSRNLFVILDWPERPENDSYLTEEEFGRRLAAVTGGRWGSGDDLIFHLPSSGVRERWVQLFYREDRGSTLGAFLDVTADVETKRRMEYERDYDVLTGLLNRRAFDAQVKKLFESGEDLGAAALLMMDLDNLKYVNDSFGHDCGDLYIQTFAQCLGYLQRFSTVVGRRSGDEFNVFLYGFRDHDEIRALMEDIQRRLERATISVPGGDQVRVRASGGLAWYSKNFATFDQILRMADFAMYTVKHTVKGAIQEFSEEEYERRSILIQGQDALNQLLEQHMVRYALQCVASARDGSVYGYEFLMRPQIQQLSEPDTLMMLAKSQSKLGQIEHLTWFEAMKTYDHFVREGKLTRDHYAFINSVGSQRMSEADLLELERLYGGLLGHTVVEITESEETNTSVSNHKKETVARWGAQLALDDFGTGYNSESVLIATAPDIIKVDISIIRGIDSDKDRRALFQNLVHYARERGIKVLAEGVETAAEVETVISYGVDYLQGFYVGKPAFEPSGVSEAVAEEIKKMYHKYHGEI